MQKLISIILPIFNEQHNIPVIYQEITSVLATIARYNYEIIFVNDGSHDRSWQIIEQLALHDSHIRALSLSRNFGHQVALSAGYHHTQGDIIITLDADMQHPPALIPEMISKWEQGAHIVYARRRARESDMFLKKLTAHYFYIFLKWIADINIPHHVADFRLIDKQVLNEIKRFKDHSPFLRGMIAWTGFKSEFVDFDCHNRLHGQAGYTWKKMITLAIDGIIGFSTLPLKMAGFIGGSIIFGGIVSLIYMCTRTLFFNATYSVLIWLMQLHFILLGTLFIFIWFLGEYIGRMYAQQRGRPLYIIEKEINPVVVNKHIPSHIQTHNEYKP